MRKWRLHTYPGHIVNKWYSCDLNPFFPASGSMSIWLGPCNERQLEYWRKSFSSKFLGRLSAAARSGWYSMACRTSGQGGRAVLTAGCCPRMKDSGKSDRSRLSCSVQSSSVAVPSTRILLPCQRAAGLSPTNRMENKNPQLGHRRSATDIYPSIILHTQTVKPSFPNSFFSSQNTQRCSALSVVRTHPALHMPCFWKRPGNTKELFQVNVHNPTTK